MYKYIVLFLAGILCSALSVPVDKPEVTDSHSSSHVNMYVENSTSTDQHAPMFNEFEGIDKAIDDEIVAILPYLNFFFDSLFGGPSATEDDCTSDMLIELVPEDATTMKTPQPSPVNLPPTPEEEGTTPIPEEPSPTPAAQ